jgi:hypothetical protein
MDLPGSLLFQRGVRKHTMEEIKCEVELEEAVEFGLEPEEV